MLVIHFYPHDGVWVLYGQNMCELGYKCSMEDLQVAIGLLCCRGYSRFRVDVKGA
jgi:hypothetical protein